MIRVTMDFVDAATGKKQTIGTMEIINDGSGTPDAGNYYVVLEYDALRATGETERIAYRHTTKVQHWPRRKRDAWGLVRQALMYLLLERRASADALEAARRIATDQPEGA